MTLPQPTSSLADPFGVRVASLKNRLRWRRFNPWAIVLVLALVVWAEEGTLIEGFEIPEYTIDGKLERMIHGKRAVVPVDPKQTVIALEGLKIELYKDEEVEAIVTADACKYDRERRFVRSSSAVKIDSRDLLITGNEFAFDGVRERFVIFKNAKVKILGLGLNKDGALKTPVAAPAVPATAPAAPAPVPSP